MHDEDSEHRLRTKILEYLGLFAGHGHLSRNDRVRYAFIHGNWALVAVDRELFETRSVELLCRLHLPSCPGVTQPKMVNLVYWTAGDLFIAGGPR